jgi:two-component system cell cycle sensor histidine kinase/response regulator CckA
VLERAFEPFFTTRKTGESKGLGLSRVYNIVKSHQGAITADSEPGKGSVFTIFFPLVNSDVTDRKGQR